MENHIITGKSTVNEQSHEKKISRNTICYKTNFIHMKQVKNKSICAVW